MAEVQASKTEEDLDTGKVVDPKPEKDNVDETNKIVEQVKDRLAFFFSDANVRQDYFIRKHLMVGEGKNKNGKANHVTTAGHVPIEALLRFNTIKQYTTDRVVIVQAANMLSDSLVVDADEQSIGRVKPFTPDLMDGNIPLSLLLRNVPLKESEGDSTTRKYDTTVDEIRSFFTQYGDVALVKLKFGVNPDEQTEERSANPEESSKKKRRKTKIPIGQALVEFHSEQHMKNAADATLTMKEGNTMEPKDEIIVGESKSTLDVMLLSEYIEMKKKEKNDTSGNSKKRERDDEEQPDEGNNDQEVPTFKLDWKPGCVIKLVGLPDGCDREALLATVAQGLSISVNDVKARKIYVDYSRGQKDGAIRFADFDDAIATVAAKLKTGDLQVSDVQVEDARVLEGEEEETYWKTFIEFKNMQIRHREEEKQSRKKRRKGGRKN